MDALREKRKNGKVSGRVVEDLPERIVKSRTALYPFPEQFIREGKSARFKFDKLVVNGDIYEYDYVSKIPVVITQECQTLLNGFSCYEQMRKSINKRGSVGVAVFIRDSISTCFNRIYEQFNDCVIFHTEQEFTGYKTDLILIFTYLSPERSVIYENENSDGVDILHRKLLLITSDFHSATILLAGDLNARTGDLKDFIPNDDLDYICGETSYPRYIFNTSRTTKDYT
ncbi:hypothetical protein MAR_022772 [Mya arenaria]|uniref:Endonuclease/exonuclease/phosphatase domain-containing protein n=1 Tax=Mya arenaria TaxID=6604 RepID=A0ABY7DL35_MYAAR|nr:hypothetical protein MAR_022772 [Mya arenaria]